jgi:hypothetical protein
VTPSQSGFAKAVFLLVVGACALAACKREIKKEAEPSSVGSGNLAEPRLKFEVPTLDAGTFLQDETVHLTTFVSNVGSVPLEISKVGRSPACTGQVEPGTLAPGAVGKLELTCNSHLYGPTRQEITIDSNDPRSARMPLSLVFNVTPLLAFDTPVVRLDLFYGQEREQEVNLVGAMLEKARIKLTMPAPPDVEIIPEPPKTEKIRSFRIHCQGRKVGHNVGNLFITTGLDNPKDVAIPYECNVGGTLEVNPSNPVINLKKSGPKLVTIDVRSTQPNFEVMAAKIIEGPFTASFEPVADGTFRVKVTAVDDRIDDESRAVTGKIIIVSNDHTEPQKKVPLFGFGQVNRSRPLEAE